MPLVSFCMPASRSADRLDTAIRSVLDQGHEDLEVIVSDDSGGSLRAVAEGIGDPRIRYVANPSPLGFAGNHTATLALARGEFIGILHDDDRLLPGYLDATLAPFEGDPALGVVFTDCFVDTGEPGGPMERYGVPVAPGRHADMLEALVTTSFMLPSKTMMRREVWDRGRHTWPDLNVADNLMYVDAALAGWAYHYVDEPLVVYLRHEQQISSNPERHRSDVVAFWELYAFEDPAIERIRRRRLAQGLVGLATVRLTQRRRGEALDLLRRARETDPAESRRRRQALWALSRVPGGGRIALARLHRP